MSGMAATNKIIFQSCTMSAVPFSVQFVRMASCQWWLAPLVLFARNSDVPLDISCELALTKAPGFTESACFAVV